MTQFAIVRYTSELKHEWDTFVDSSRNATFLLRRDYMDYHSDRFSDFSLMVYTSDSRHRKVAALLPACLAGTDTIVSHAGLTYGGFILPMHGADGSTMVAITDAVLTHLRSCGISHLRYKAIPHIYHRYPAEEDLYALFRAGARLEETNLSSTIDLTHPLRFNENSRRNCRRAAAAGITVAESSDFAGFWSVLTTLLAERYATTPVHSLQEIELLHSRFPDNIRLFTATNPTGAIVAGSVVYFTATCAHAQYIAASPAGKEYGALPLLFNHIISQHCSGLRYFDFGISNEDHGQYLNAGLLAQKNGMGGRGIAYSIYTLDF
jgi:hypothetical protein